MPYMDTVHKYCQVLTCSAEKGAEHAGYIFIYEITGPAGGRSELAGAGGRGANELRGSGEEGVAMREACEQRVGTGWAEPKILGTPHDTHVRSAFNHCVDHCLPLSL